MHDMESRKKRKQRGRSPKIEIKNNNPPFRDSQVPNLSVCGHLFHYWEEEIMEQTSITFSEVTLNIALVLATKTCRRQFSPKATVVLVVTVL